MTVPDKEQREFFRYQVRALVDFELPHEYKNAFASNIGEKGMLVEMHKPLPLGTKTVIRFMLPTLNYVFEIRATVLWAIQRSSEEKLAGLKDGMGIAFDSMEKDCREELDRYLKTLKET